MSPRAPTTLTTEAPEHRDVRPLARHLAVLVGREAAGFVELRARRAGDGMRQRFYPTRRLPAAAVEILELARVTDVYVGCLPCRRRAGGHDALGRGWVLWADCDDPAAVAALAAFDPAPAIVVRSGTEGNVHAYWPLRRSAEAGVIAAANRRLALALGADVQSSEAARILRPPATWNFKHDPPAAVSVERLGPARRYPLEVILDGLPDPFDAPSSTAVPFTPRAPGRTEDRLLAIAPADYVEALTGLEVGRDGKVSCPFHADRTPSLHVYAEPARGWTCFGCGRGGSIFDLAAELEGITPRGLDFVALRHRLEERFGIPPTARTSR